MYIPLHNVQYKLTVKLAPVHRLYVVSLSAFFETLLKSCTNYLSSDIHRPIPILSSNVSNVDVIFTFLKGKLAQRCPALPQFIWLFQSHSSNS